MKIAQRITRAVGVAPEPEDLAFEEAVSTLSWPMTCPLSIGSWIGIGSPVRVLSR